MKTVRVGFSYHPGKVFSGFIKLCTKSEVSHTYVRLPSTVWRPRGAVFQASGMVVNVKDGEAFEKESVVVEEYDVQVSDETWKNSKRMAVTELNKPYSVAQVFGFLWVLLMRRCGKKVRNPFSNGKHAYVCVELVADYIGLSSDAESMTPEDLRRWCEKNAKRVR